jgi:hypothetical protein
VEHGAALPEQIGSSDDAFDEQVDLAADPVRPCDLALIFCWSFISACGGGTGWCASGDFEFVERSKAGAPSSSE